MAMVPSDDHPFQTRTRRDGSVPPSSWPVQTVRPDQGPFNLQQLVNVRAPVHVPWSEAPPPPPRGVAGTAELRFAPAGVAQLAEHLFCKQAVRGSTPLASSGLAGSGFARRSQARLGTSGIRPLGDQVSGRRGSVLSGSVLSGRVRFDRYANVRFSSEGCPSGQREQAVNLPELSYVGSNPTPSTPQHVSTNTRGAVVRSVHFAGVAQLVERQPSKLNVAGSNPVSRSKSPTV